MGPLGEQITETGSPLLQLLSSTLQKEGYVPALVKAGHTASGN